MKSDVKSQSLPASHKKQLKVREKIQGFGAQNLSNVELLTLILGSGNVQLSALQLATQLLNTHPLSLLHQQPLTKLTALPGLGIAKAAQILAALELGRRSQSPQRNQIKSPQHVLAQVEKIRRQPREHIVCLYLNAHQELLRQETIAIGGLNYSLLEVRDVFSPALRLPASALILVHNHPSGSIRPSQEDLVVTKKLIEAGRLLGVTLLDHLIVTENQYFSFKEQGKLAT